MGWYSPSSSRFFIHPPIKAFQCADGSFQCQSVGKPISRPKKCFFHRLEPTDLFVVFPHQLSNEKSGYPGCFVYIGDLMGCVQNTKTLSGKTTPKNNSEFHDAFVVEGFLAKGHVIFRELFALMGRYRWALLWVLSGFLPHPGLFRLPASITFLYTPVNLHSNGNSPMNVDGFRIF